MSNAHSIVARQTALSHLTAISCRSILQDLVKQVLLLGSYFSSYLLPASMQAAMWTVAAEPPAHCSLHCGSVAAKTWLLSLSRVTHKDCVSNGKPVLVLALGYIVLEAVAKCSLVLHHAQGYIAELRTAVSASQ